ncbi:hypothetical protein chiPu_0017806 [Chiloscyllium punctatum]|uniref:Uncharacterized protein n=1 Tax=Chiloscyllium punctatum TaxID=137246 RepID=A0A401RJ19_CHIPU|nr:hypothetical protein [Chiloscyllium punctatum]
MGNFIGTIGTPSITILAQAKRTDGKEQGYQLTGSMEGSDAWPRMHIRVVELKEDSSWKMCVDAAILKAHKAMLTIYYQGFELPLPVHIQSMTPVIQTKGFKSINEIPRLLLTMNQRECISESERVVTFDGNELKHTILNDCYYVLTKDCSPTPKFVLLTRRDVNQQRKKAIKLLISVPNIVIEAYWTLAGIKFLVDNVKTTLSNEEKVIQNCKVRRTFVELGKLVKLEGQESKCYSVERVQRCLEGCSPIETHSRIANFHCVPANRSVNAAAMLNFWKKSVHVSHSVDSHTDCVCGCADM